MMELYLCKKCKKLVLVSKHSQKQGIDICKSCGATMILTDLTYEKWIQMTGVQREEEAKRY